MFWLHQYLKKSYIYQVFQFKFGNSEFTLVLEERILDPDEIDDANKSRMEPNPHYVRYVRDTLISFITKQKATFDKLLENFKIPKVFGSMIENICQREKVDVPLILTKIFS